jgi:hypothetical protein
MAPVSETRNIQWQASASHCKGASLGGRRVCSPTSGLCRGVLASEERETSSFQHCRQRGRWQIHTIDRLLYDSRNVYEGSAPSRAITASGEKQLAIDFAQLMMAFGGQEGITIDVAIAAPTPRGAISSSPILRSRAVHRNIATGASTADLTTIALLMRAKASSVPPYCIASLLGIRTSSPQSTSGPRRFLGGYRKIGPILHRWSNVRRSQSHTIPSALSAATTS